MLSVSALEKAWAIVSKFIFYTKKAISNSILGFYLAEGALLLLITTPAQLAGGRGAIA
jgi:hypothetical protein